MLSACIGDTCKLWSRLYCWILNFLVAVCFFDPLYRYLNGLVLKYWLRWCWMPLYLAFSDILGFIWMCSVAMVLLLWSPNRFFDEKVDIDSDKVEEHIQRVIWWCPYSTGYAETGYMYIVLLNLEILWVSMFV